MRSSSRKASFCFFIFSLCNNKTSTHLSSELLYIHEMFPLPSPLETCLPFLNIYAMRPRCHVFTLIFTPQRMRCSAYTIQRGGRAAGGERKERETSESTVFPQDGKCGRYSEPQECLVGRTLYLNRASYWQSLMLWFIKGASWREWQHGGRWYICILPVAVCRWIY